MKSILKSKEMSIIAIIVVLSIALTSISRAFLTYNNILDILKGNSVLGILAVGMTLVIITGGIDVSVAAVTTSSIVITGKLLVFLPDNPISIVLMFLIAIAVGVILGALNGFLVSKIQIPAIVVTLGTMSMINGIILYITNGEYLNSSSFPSIFTKFANFNIGGVSILIIIFAIVAIFTWYLLKYTVIGREVLAVGGNKESSIRAGINFDKVQIFVYAYMGLLAGVAAVSQLSYTKAVDPNGLIGFEMQVIAAVVLGGANIMGGRGTIFGTFLGVLLLGIMQNGLILAHIDVFWQQVVVGSIILIAVIYDQIQTKRAKDKLATIEVEA
jgi:simple sugar transport system permease protein